jgi:NADH-ubiquinone oxidoreductase chain 5
MVLLLKGYTVYLRRIFNILGADLDFIIESSVGCYHFSGLFSFWLVSISAVVTALYSTRLLYLAFLGYPNGPQSYYSQAHEPALVIALPLFILALFSIFFGYFARDLFLGLGTGFFGSSLFTHPNHSILVNTEFGLPLWVKLFPVIGCLSGGFLLMGIYMVYSQGLVIFKLTSFGNYFYWLFNQKFFFDNFYTSFILYPALNFGYITNKILDRGVLEILGPYGLSQYFNLASLRITRFDSSAIPTFGLFIIFNALALLAIITYLPDPKYLVLLLVTLWFV